MWPQLDNTLLGVLATVGGIVVWGIRLEQKIKFVDQVLQAHLLEKKELMATLEARLERIEIKVDNIRVRCAAFHHSYPDALTHIEREHL